MISMQPRRQTDAETFFIDWFLRLRGFTPYPWQTALFVEMLAGNLRPFLYGPTGGGKTEIISIWLLGLLWEIKQYGKRRLVPLRLFYCVDRRKVADHAERVSRQIVTAVEGDSELKELLLRIGKHMPKQPLLPIAVRRGERIERWDDVVSSPTIPAIICGTPDLLVSPLIFAPYCTPWKQALPECGLMLDSLVVLDEAQLSVAAHNALRFVKTHNAGRNLGIPFWVVSMSATPRDGQGLGRNDPCPCGSGKKYKKCCEFPESDCQKMSGYSAEKWATLWAMKMKNGNADAAQADWVADQVRQAPERLVIVYVSTPRSALEIYRRLTDEGLHAQVLTGKQRGFERGELMLQPFEKGAPNDGKKHVLICTAAGELGLDISSELLISDLPSLDQFVQRVGRNARWGGIGRVLIFHPEWGGEEPYVIRLLYPKNTNRKAKKSEEQVKEEKKDLDARAKEIIAKTCGIDRKRVRVNNDEKPVYILPQRVPDLEAALRHNLGCGFQMTKQPLVPSLAALKFLRGRQGSNQISVSTASIRPWEDEEGYWDAFSEQPKSLPLNMGLIEQNFLLGYRSGIPAEIYIRGLDKNFDIRMVVRKEADMLHQLDTHDLLEYQRIPALKHEILKFRVTDEFLQCVRGWGRMLVAVSAVGEPIIIDPETDLDPEKLHEGLLYLPQDIAMRHMDETGHFVLQAADYTDDGIRGKDVFDHPDQSGAAWIRALAQPEISEDGEEEETLYAVSPLSDFVADEPLTVRSIQEWCPDGYRWFEFELLDGKQFSKQPKPALWFARPKQIFESCDLDLDPHSNKVANYAKEFSLTLGLPSEVVESLYRAGLLHDFGKGHWRWIKASGNKTGKAMAKLGRYSVGMARMLGGMRHEFVSALEYRRQYPGDDLGVWLGANHHGFCRPYFEEKAFPPEDKAYPKEANVALNRALPEVIDNLLRTYTPWELAWFAAILRAADRGGGD